MEFDTIYDFANWCSDNKTGNFTETVNIHGEELTFDVYIVNQVRFVSQEQINNFFELCTQNDANTQLVISKQILISKGLIFTPPYRCRGLILFVDTLINIGTISMTARGAVGNGNNLYLCKIDDVYQIVPKDGAAGSAYYSMYTRSWNINGNAGSNGTGRQTGGGSSGGIAHNETSSTAWYYGGGKGTSYSGGAGCGGVCYTGPWTVFRYYTHNSPNPGTGAGTNGYALSSGWNNYTSAAGGAGNPGGKGSVAGAGADPNNPALKGKDGTGGLLIIYTNHIISYGNYSSEGSKGGDAMASGGGSGGGSINIFYTEELSNKNKFSVVGGAGGTGSHAKGAKGGNGTVSKDVIPEIENKFFSETLKLNSDIYKNIYMNEVLFDVNQFFGE